MLSKERGLELTHLEFPAITQVASDPGLVDVRTTIPDEEVRSNAIRPTRVDHVTSQVQARPTVLESIQVLRIAVLHSIQHIPDLQLSGRFEPEGTIAASDSETLFPAGNSVGFLKRRTPIGIGHHVDHQGTNLGQPILIDRVPTVESAVVPDLLPKTVDLLLNEDLRRLHAGVEPAHRTEHQERGRRLKGKATDQTTVSIGFCAPHVSSSLVSGYSETLRLEGTADLSEILKHFTDPAGFRLRTAIEAAPATPIARPRPIDRAADRCRWTGSHPPPVNRSCRSSRP